MPGDDVMDRLYGHFSAGGRAPADLHITLPLANGFPYARCTAEASSLDEAIRRVLRYLKDKGLTIKRLEAETLSFLDAACPQTTVPEIPKPLSAQPGSQGR